MNPIDIIDLIQYFGMISLLSFGGGNSLIPDIQRHAVLESHWLSNAEFIAAYAISQTAPGPSSLIVALIGWQTAGWAGAIASTVAMFAPSSIATGVVTYYWQRFRDKPWLGSIEKGLAPVTIGLILASGWIVSQEAGDNYIAYGITAATAIIFAKTSLNPLWLMLTAGIIGAFVWR